MPYKNAEKRKDYQKNWIRERRKLFVKLCIKCGTTENLEVHHRNRDDKVTHRIWSWSIARIVEELKRCDILCHDCHRNETNKQRPVDLDNAIAHRMYTL